MDRANQILSQWTFTSSTSSINNSILFRIFIFRFFNQIDFIRTQFEKQYNSLKRRLDDTETENERLTTQHRSESKELLLYRQLVQASDTSDSSTKNKDYQQLKATIDAILKENERLYAEIHDFKTSDPVYEQVQLLETANKHLKQELIQITHQNNRFKKIINIDEIKHLKSQLTKINDECEQLKLLNKKLINQIQIHQRPIPTPSPPSPSKQVSILFKNKSTYLFHIQKKAWLSKTSSARENRRIKTKRGTIYHFRWYHDTIYPRPEQRPC